MDFDEDFEIQLLPEHIQREEQVTNRSWESAKCCHKIYYGRKNLMLLNEDALHILIRAEIINTLALRQRSMMGIIIMKQEYL